MKVSVIYIVVLGAIVIGIQLLAHLLAEFIVNKFKQE